MLRDERKSCRVESICNRMYLRTCITDGWHSGSGCSGIIHNAHSSEATLAEEFGVRIIQEAQWAKLMGTNHWFSAA